MGERVVLETPCAEHGEIGRIHNTEGEYSGGVMCPGGSRRVLVEAEPNYEAATDALFAAVVGSKRAKSIAEQAERVVDAALEGLRLVRETDVRGHLDRLVELSEEVGLYEKTAEPKKTR